MTIAPASRRIPAINRPVERPARGSILTLGVEAGRTSVCLLESVAGIYRLAAWRTAPRQPGLAADAQLAGLCQKLSERLGRILWDDQAGAPFAHSPDPLRYPPLESVVVSASPRGRLRVWLAGLSQERSLQAARAALAAAPVQIVGESCLTATTTVESLAAALHAVQPEVLVVVGGYDVPDPATHAAILTLSALLGSALQAITELQRPTILFAGNLFAAQAATAHLRSRQRADVVTVRNVLPAPQVIYTEELTRLLNELYHAKCRHMTGALRLEQWCTAPYQVATVDANFIRLVRLWMEMQGLHELYALYCAPEQWLHVWVVEAGGSAAVHYTEPQTWPYDEAEWPELQLVCGPWPDGAPPPTVRWWDRSAFAPLIAAVGQVAPAAMKSVLEADLLATIEAETR